MPRLWGQYCKPPCITDSMRVGVVVAAVGIWRKGEFPVMVLSLFWKRADARAEILRLLLSTPMGLWFYVTNAGFCWTWLKLLDRITFAPTGIDRSYMRKFSKSMPWVEEFLVIAEGGIIMSFCGFWQWSSEKEELGLILIAIGWVYLKKHRSPFD